MEPESLSHRLWQQARAGNSAAFEQLFALHTPRLLVLIRYRMSDRLKAILEPEDILQEAYLAAFRSLPDFAYTHDGAFIGWLCRIVENRLRDLHDYHTAAKRQTVERPARSATGPWTALQRSENRQRIERALGELSVEQREVLLLRYFEGLTAIEVATRIGKTAGAVRSLTARALLELGRILNTETGRADT